MVKQELTKDALAKLENLRRQFADFQEDCSKLLKSIQNDDFLDSETAAGVQNTLANITTIQNQLGTIYQNLSLGSLPQKFTEAAENISNLQHELSLKAVFIDAVDFFNALHCRKAEIEEILVAQKESLKNISIESLSVTEAKDQLQKYVEFKQFYDGEKSLLTNVSIQFGFELICNLLEDKAGYYIETMATAAEDTSEPVTNEVAVPEVKPARNEATVEATAEDKADAVAEAEPKPVASEVVEDKPEPVASEVVEDKTEPVVSEVVEDKTEPAANEATEAEANSVANEAKKDKEGSDITVAAEEKAEIDFVMPAAPMPKEIFSSVTIEPEISRAADKENKPITASVATRERKKLIDIGSTVDSVIELHSNSLVNAKWILAANGKLSKRTAEDSLDNFNFTLENLKKYGYAVKYDCGNDRCFFTITSRGFKAFNYMLKKDSKALSMQHQFLERKNVVDHLVDIKAFDMMLLYMSFADIIRCLSVENDVQVLSDSFDHDGKFWLGACTIKKAKVKYQLW